ncbi:unnamed protein product [Citrullus colocynthis]|uniref:Uncharacterized protein n=1 Tax=Citrullus colocynthis TaxID=252529 RepID=A0ABP0Y0J5_9ROSI
MGMGSTTTRSIEEMPDSSYSSRQAAINTGEGDYEFNGFREEFEATLVKGRDLVEVGVIVKLEKAVGEGGEI